MQDMIGIDTQRYHDELDAQDYRREQAKAHVMPEDMVALAAHELNETTSPLLPIAKMLKAGRRPTITELIIFGDAIVDLLEDARVQLVDSNLNDGWFIGKED